MSSIYRNPKYTQYMRANDNLTGNDVTGKSKYSPIASQHQERSINVHAISIYADTLPLLGSVYRLGNNMNHLGDEIPGNI